MNSDELEELARNLNLLFVEDDPLVRESSAEIFENYFQKVTTASDGEEGLEYFKNFSYDLVVTDIVMPHMNGIEMCRNIKELNKNQKIIVMSAHDERQYLIDLIRISVSDFLQKPLGMQEMIDVFHRVCREIQEEKMKNQYARINSEVYWDFSSKTLYVNSQAIDLTAQETKFFELLVKNPSHKFADLEIFEYINNKDSQKEFSKDSIKSLVKRLRKKIPDGIVKTQKNLGYSINL